MGSFKFMVFTEPKPGQDEEYNDWYDNRHLSDTLSVDGIVEARRYRLAPTQTPKQGLPTYLTIYEIDAEHVDDIRKAIVDAVNSGAMPISGSLDPAATLSEFYEAL